MGEIDDANVVFRQIDTSSRPAEAMYVKGLI